MKFKWGSGKIFSESLWVEYRRSNVRVASLHLSGIEGSTSFMAKTTPARRRLIKLLGVSMDPAVIVARSLEKFDRGKVILVPDTWTFLNIYTLKFTDLIRLIGGKLSLLLPSAFFHWFLDGKEAREREGEAER